MCESYKKGDKSLNVYGFNAKKHCVKEMTVKGVTNKYLLLRVFTQDDSFKPDKD